MAEEENGMSHREDGRSGISAISVLKEEALYCLKYSRHLGKAIRRSRKNKERSEWYGWRAMNTDYVALLNIALATIRAFPELESEIIEEEEGA